MTPDILIVKKALENAILTLHACYEFKIAVPFGVLHELHDEALQAVDRLSQPLFPAEAFDRAPVEKPALKKLLTEPSVLESYKLPAVKDGLTTDRAKALNAFNEWLAEEQSRPLGTHITDKTFALYLQAENIREALKK